MVLTSYPCIRAEGHATRNDIVDDIVDDPSSTMVFNVAKIASARASSTKSLTISLRVAGPLVRGQDYKEKHKTRLKTNVKRTVLNNTKLRHF